MGKENDGSNVNGQVQAVAYVDGSYDPLTNAFSYGVILLYDGKEVQLSEKFVDDSLADMNNVAGEIKGAEAAIQYCIDNNIHSVEIYHDYD